MITVAHSPDSDDYFMFWAIVNNKIDLEGLEFVFEQQDTSELNKIATQAKHDIVAISAAAYRLVSENYLILTSGASVGRNYGPVVVSQKDLKVGELNSSTIAIPGKTTTAALVLSHIAPDAKTVEIPIEPFEQVFEALRKGTVDAALLIHEGQISYRDRNLHCVVDTGKWWAEKYQLPLPLGVNVIRRGLGPEKVQHVSRVLANSIRYALDHKEQILEELIELNKARNADLQSREGVTEYLGRYANEDTFSMDEDCKKAVSILLGANHNIEFA